MLSVGIAFLLTFSVPIYMDSKGMLHEDTSKVVPTKHLLDKDKTAPKIQKGTCSILPHPESDLLSHEIEVYQDNYEDYIQDPEDEIRFPPEIFDMYSD